MNCVPAAYQMLRFVWASSPMDDKASGCEPSLTMSNSWPRQWPGLERHDFPQNFYTSWFCLGWTLSEKNNPFCKAVRCSYFTKCYFITWEVILSIPPPISQICLVLGNENPSSYLIKCLNANKQDVHNNSFFFSLWGCFVWFWFGF